MRLKKIEIAGFKSFMDRTKLHFEPGITAVVGPNGCGKSNVVDAIQWAMGETSAKTLRGKAMEDVIFGGSEMHKPLGMAEVILTFENGSENGSENGNGNGNGNGDGNGDLATRSEIEVSRRLFRSGESEYAINRTVCRRRDVWELFMDTGLGNRSFAIVAQDRVSRIIQAKPEERRVVIEEVAGISKYRSRREAAQKKLDATNQNMLRIQDIRREVKRQIQSLERQAKKAERYKKLRKTILETERRIKLRQWSGLQENRLSRDKACQDLEQRSETLSTELQVKENAIQQGRISIVGKEQSAGRAQELLYKYEANVHEIEGTIRRYKEELQNLDVAETMLERETQILDERIQRAREESTRYREEHDSFFKEKEEAKAFFEKTESTVSGLEADLNGLIEQLEERKSQLVEWLSERATTSNSLSHHQRQSEESARFLERHQEELEDLETKSQEFTDHLEELETALQESEAEKEDLQQRSEFARESIAQRTNERKEVQTRLEEVRTELQGAKSRFDSLHELQESKEGFSDGVRSLIAAKRSGELEVGGELRVLAEVMDIAEGSEAAVAGVLGDRLQYIVVSDVDEADRLLRSVKEKELGRVGFIPLKGKTAGSQTQHSGNDGAGLILKDIAWESGYEGLGGVLLDGVEVVEDTKAALDAWRSNGHHLLVTRTGEVLYPYGILEGGDRKDASLGFLQRKTEMRRLEETVSDLDEREKAISSDLDEIVNDLQYLNEESDQLRQQTHETELHLTEIRKDLSQTKEESRRNSQRLEYIEMEVEERSQELVELRQAVEDETARLEELEDKIRETESRVKELDAAKQARQAEFNTLKNEQTQARVRYASAKERCESLDREVTRLVDRIKELQEERVLKIEQQTQGGRKKSDIEQKLRSCEEDLNIRIREHAEAEERHRAAVIELDEHRKGLEEIEQAALELRRTIRETENDLQAQRLERQELLLRMEHVEKELQDRLEIEAGDIGTLAGELPEENPEKDEAALKSLQTGLDRMGDVNLMAVEQYEELKERFEYLTSQEEDLEQSIQSLQTAIRRINRTSRKRFKEAFEALNAQFQRVFPILFNGGEARLELTDKPDVLDAGVEIVARPPGKRLQSITLLSGGEKALTAVTMIFSMIMIKPTPFCLMDEVDAPLDDANIDRFNQMIKNLSRNSQFILVTHNKRTMELADTLYGVTMETPGVSKLISVKMN